MNTNFSFVIKVFLYILITYCTIGLCIMCQIRGQMNIPKLDGKLLREIAAPAEFLARDVAK